MFSAKKLYLNISTFTLTVACLDDVFRRSWTVVVIFNIYVTHGKRKTPIESGCGQIKASAKMVYVTIFAFPDNFLRMS